MQGASIQGGGQPGGFSPGQNQVTPQDHEKVSNAVQLPPYAQVFWSPLFTVTMWRSWVFRVPLEMMFLLLELFMILSPGNLWAWS